MQNTSEAIVVMTFNDKAGRKVKVGDLIVYGHAFGRCAGLQYGKVLEVREATPEQRDSGARIQVQGVDWDWGGSYAPRLRRPSVLQFPDRVLVLNEEQVHPKVLALLKKET